ncbi:DUF3540 domain-containing protein [Paraburkholderia hayleyella]|uniref:DUF3540 domain-containing protein n=1 Tax=Paraburkholderia hayleyella TaxID=2152889 RepID=UPI001291A38C|nr:DUF3540 domain-containing protein [Paraburkholderia hayleyella]
MQAIRKPTLQAHVAAFYHAEVTALHADDTLAVSCDGFAFEVRLAAGCLLQPAVGDTVLVTVAGETGYVLNVLEQAAAAGARRVLRLGDEVQLATEAGTLSLEARHAALRFTSCDWHSGTLHWHGDEARSVWRERSDWSERRFEAAGTAEECLGESVRRIAGHEETSAHSMRQRIAAEWEAYAQDVSLFGEGRVKVDTEGEIQLG